MARRGCRDRGQPRRSVPSAAPRSRRSWPSLPPSLTSPTTTATGTRRHAGHLPPLRGATMRSIPSPGDLPTSCRTIRNTRSQLSRADLWSAVKKDSSSRRAGDSHCWCTLMTPPAFSRCPTGRTAVDAADRQATRDSTGPAPAALRSRPSRPTVSGPSHCTSTPSGPTRSPSNTATCTTRPTGPSPQPLHDYFPAPASLPEPRRRRGHRGSDTAHPTRWAVR